MTKKFSDYDMRKFVINDTKDVYAFFDAVSKGLDQTERLIKKLAMSNAAQASVIRSLERGRSTIGTTSEEDVESPKEAPSIIQTLETHDAERAKVDVLAKMKAVDSPEPAQDEPEEASEEVDESTPISEPVEAVEEPQTPQNDDVEVPNRYRGYEKKTFSNGQSRYFRDGGAMVAAKDVPEAIKTVLDGGQ